MHIGAEESARRQYHIIQTSDKVNKITSPLVSVLSDLHCTWNTNKSSANSFMLHEIDSTISLMYVRKSVGPRTDP